MNAPTPSALRVLVVDDDPDLCCLLSDYLSANGFVVRTVGDGAAMREALARELHDAIVMDLMLPGEDGLSLTRSIKAQWGMPVLMLSARGEEMDRVIGLEVGADDYLPKPFGPRELLARLETLATTWLTGEAMGQRWLEGLAAEGAANLDHDALQQLRVAVTGT